MDNVSFGTELDSLIPAELEILVGKSKSKVRKVTIYPYSLSDLKKISAMVQKLAEIFFKSVAPKDKDSNVGDFVKNNLDKVGRIISVATYNPDQVAPTEKELDVKTLALMDEITLKQLIYGFEKVMEVNDTSFLVSGVTRLIQGISKPLIATNPPKS